MRRFAHIRIKSITSRPPASTALENMKGFSEPPQNIVASCFAATFLGSILGTIILLFSFGWGSEESGGNILEFAKGIFGISAYAFFIGICVVMAVVAPVMAGLRAIHLGGPLSALLISLIPPTIMAVIEPEPLIGVWAIYSPTTAVLFCLFAYKKSFLTIGSARPAPRAR